MSVIVTLLSFPASILGNEAALRIGRHRAITVVMIVSAVAGVLDRRLSTAAPSLWIPARPCSHLRRHRARRFRGPDFRHERKRGSRATRRDDGHPFDGRFGLSAAGAWSMGVALDLGGGPDSTTGWFTAFALLAAGVLLGPMALRWSRKTA